MKQQFIQGARRQTVVIEYREVMGGPEWWVMLHDGQIHVFDTASAALRCVKRAANRRNVTITITTIEWRNTPDGFTHPKV